MKTKKDENKKDDAIPQMSTVDFLVKMQNIRSVMPDELLTEIDAISSFTNQLRWRMGDLVNNVAGVLAATGQGDLMDACWFVSVQTGEFRTQNTLRQYASVAAFYDLKHRKIYQHDNLPFNHFTFAKSLVGEVKGTNTKKKGVPAWEVCLQHSCDFYDSHGYPTTVKKLEELFKDYRPSNNPLVSGGHAVPPVVVVDGADGKDGYIPYSADYSSGGDADADAEVDGDAPAVARAFGSRVRDLFSLLPLFTNLWSAEKQTRVAILLESLEAEVKSE